MACRADDQIDDRGLPPIARAAASERKWMDLYIKFSTGASKRPGPEGGGRICQPERKLGYMPSGRASIVIVAGFFLAGRGGMRCGKLGWEVR